MKKTSAMIGCITFLMIPWLTSNLRVVNESPAADSKPSQGNNLRPTVARVTRKIQGWTVHISRDLLDREPQLTETALQLLDRQLDEIVRVVPAKSVAELQRVPLYISAEYPGVNPKAEYHPGADWLREHGRDPAMAKSVEFTNVRIFEDETIRMRNFTLHELAHAYHDRVLANGFENREVQAAFARAKASGSYDQVERHNGKGRPATFEKSYAMTNPMEYFAECTEAYFSRNDFFPFTRDELKAHDPDMFELLGQLWKETDPKSKK